MGKYIRHGIGAFVGASLGALVGWLAASGIEVDPAQISLIELWLTDGLSLFVTVLGYAVVEKFLKRFPSLDLEGYIDRLWLRREASASERRF